MQSNENNQRENGLTTSSFWKWTSIVIGSAEKNSMHVMWTFGLNTTGLVKFLSDVEASQNHGKNGRRLNTGVMLLLF